MKAQEVITALDRMKDAGFGVLACRNTKTKSDVSILRDHGMFKIIMLNVGGIFYFDAYKPNCCDDMINIFSKDDEIGKIDCGFWELKE